MPPRQAAPARQRSCLLALCVLLSSWGAVAQGQPPIPAAVPTSPELVADGEKLSPFAHQRGCGGRPGGGRNGHAGASGGGSPAAAAAACQSHTWCPPPAARLLLSLPPACSNWDAATRAVSGEPWESTARVCDWKGVSCVASGSSGALPSLGVVGLELVGLNLSCTLPRELAGMQSIVTINLSDNAFRGTIPQPWVNASNLPALESLLLGGNKLEGVLPLSLTAAANTVNVR